MSSERTAKVCDSEEMIPSSINLGNLLLRLQSETLRGIVIQGNIIDRLVRDRAGKEVKWIEVGPKGALVRRSVCSLLESGTDGETVDRARGRKGVEFVFASGQMRDVLQQKKVV